MTTKNQTTKKPPVTETRILPVDASLQAEAASAHARVNIPLNLNNWKHRTQEEQDQLLWMHQHILDQGLSWQEACDALNTSRTTIYRLLKGIYEAEDWSKQINAIRSYRRIAEQRATIIRQEFVPNSISRLIWAGLDYALANNSITTIIGESRSGKTISVKAWAEANNHGRSVFVTAPPVGGIKMLMRSIAAKVGSNKNQSIVQLAESLHRAFNRNRILIVDEAHRLMPNDARTLNPANLELLRDLHDQTGCALALIATARFNDRLRTGSYQFEQLIGRIGMPIRLPKTIPPDAVTPIIGQFLPGAPADIREKLRQTANQPGRLGIVVETLKVASRIAAKAKTKLTPDHIQKAIDLRNRMTGANQ